MATATGSLCITRWQSLFSGYGRGRVRATASEYDWQIPAGTIRSNSILSKSGSELPALRRFHTGIGSPCDSATIYRVAFFILSFSSSIH